MNDSAWYVDTYFCEDHLVVLKLKDPQLSDDHVHTPEVEEVFKDGTMIGNMQRWHYKLVVIPPFACQRKGAVLQ